MSQPLLTSEEPFRLLVEQVSDYAIFLLDPTGHVMSWNAGAQRMKGYSAAEIIGRPLSTFYPPQDREKSERLLAAARTNRVEDEGWRVRKDGTLFWANAVITPLRDSQGGLVGFAKVTRDLTDRRRAEEERVKLAEQAAAREAAERTVDLLLRLNTLAGALAAARTPEEIAQVVVSEGAKSLGATSSAFVEPHDGRFVLIATQGVADSALKEWGEFSSDENSPFAIAYRSATAQWVKSPDDRAKTHVGMRTITDAASAAYLPLLRGNQALGVVAFWFDDSRVFTPELRILMEALAAQVAQAHERANAYARELAALRRVDALKDLSVALSRALSTEEVARVVVDVGMRIAGADTCTLYTLDDDTGALDLIGERGCNPAVIERVRHIAADSGYPGFDKPLWAETPKDYAAIFPNLARVETDGPRAKAFWSLPLLAENRAVGLLGMGFYKPRRFSAEERDLVGIVAHQCAAALLRARRLEAERDATNTAQNLRASLFTTVRSIGDAVIATDAQGRITMMNPVAESLTGWAELEAQGRVLSEVFRIVNEQTRESVPSPVEKVLKDGLVVGLANHTMLIARDGHETPIDDSGAPIRPVGGDIEGVVLVFRDVTEKRREEVRRTFLADATAALAESLDYEATLSKVASLAVPKWADWSAVDILNEGEARPKRLAVAHVDPAKLDLARMLDAKYPTRPDAARGVPNVLLTGRSELYPDIPDELLAAGCVDEEHLRLARELGLRSAMVVPLVARDRVLGAITFVFAESERHYTSEDLGFANELARRCGMAIDNARLYASEQQARRSAETANRAKDEFLAVVSHELRNPLAPIVTALDVMDLRGVAGAERERTILRRQVQHLNRLVDDLLDVSRIVSGKIQLAKARVEIAEVIGRAIEMINPLLDRGTHTLRLSVPATGLPIDADATRMVQVISNLLANACKYTDPGGNISVAAAHEGEQVVIRIGDSGLGIEPEMLSRVFDLFAQEAQPVDRARGGLGLGLPIARSLVNLHGGTISAESAGRGMGALFTVRLPIASSVMKATVNEPAQTIAPTPQALARRVLIVDDNQDAAETLAEMLSASGHTARVAFDGPAALAVLPDFAPDVALLDIGLPVMDGYELARRMRESPAGKKARILAVTGYGQENDRLRSQAAGFDAHLIKPLSLEDLLQAIEANPATQNAADYPEIR